MKARNSQVFQNPYLLSLDLGKGYGSVDFDVKWNNRDYRIKGYPTLIHCSKVDGMKHMASTTSNSRTWYQRVDNLNRRLDKLNHFYNDEILM